MSFDSFCLYLACLRKKCIPVLIDAGTKFIKIKKIIDKFNPNYFFYQTGKSLDSEIQELNFKKKNVYGLKNFFLNEKKINLKLDNNIFLLLSTSGSTGSSKFVKISKENIVSNTKAIIDYLNMKSNDTTITNLPMNYSYGLSLVNSHLYVGGTIILSSKSIIDRQTISLVEQNKISNFNGVPSTYEMIFKFKLESIYLKNLKYVTQAGGALNEDTYNKLNNLSKKYNNKFFIMYGQTEASPRMSYLLANNIKFKRGMIGKPIQGGTFCILDKNNKEILVPNKEGKLFYSGPNIFLGYANSYFEMTSIKKSQKKLILNTGDLAKFDENYNYYLVARESRYIKIYDKRVNLEDLDAILQRYNHEIISTFENNKIILWYINEKLIKSEILNIIKKYTSLLSKNFRFVYIKEFPKNSSGKVLFKKLKSKNGNNR